MPDLTPPSRHLRRLRWHLWMGGWWGAAPCDHVRSVAGSSGGRLSKHILFLFHKMFLGLCDLCPVRKIA